MCEQPTNQQRQVIGLVEDNALHPWDVWIEYIGLAGQASDTAVTDYIYGRGDLPPLERDLVDLTVAALLAMD